MGSPYCDQSLGPINCDATHFSGFHFFDVENIYCPWNMFTNIADNQVACVNGDTENRAQMPGSRRLMQRSPEYPRMLNYSNFLHVSHPDLEVEQGI